MAPEMDFNANRFRATLLEEIGRNGSPRISIGFPLQPTWDRTRHGQLQLRSLLDDAADAMRRYGHEPGDADALLAPASALLDDSPSWAGPAQGVLVLLSPDGPEAGRVHRLPFAPDAFSVVDDRYHVRPIWRHLEPDLRFYILALSAGGVVLYRASRHAIAPVELMGVPTTLDEALQYDQHVRSVRYHTRTPVGGGGDSRRRAAVYYGHEDAGDKAYVKEGLLRFFRTLDNGVRNVLCAEATPPPLVLAGTEVVRGVYRKANLYRHVTETDIDGVLSNGAGPDWDTSALHEQGWSLVAPRADAARAAALDRFYKAPDRTAANVGSVLLAATTGRVDTLFVTSAQETWGRYDPERYTVEVHSQREAGDTELMNAAVVHTLQSGGTVYVGAPEDVPEGAPIAALLRY